MASSCCTLLGESTEKVNAGRGQPDKYEMEGTSQRCITEADNLLVNELDLAERGQESSSLSAGENSELEPKSIKNQDVLAPSETCFKKDFSQYNCIDYKSPEPDESSGTDCKSNLEAENHSHQIVC